MKKRPDPVNDHVSKTHHINDPPSRAPPENEAPMSAFLTKEASLVNQLLIEALPNKRVPRKSSLTKPMPSKEDVSAKAYVTKAALFTQHPRGK